VFDSQINVLDLRSSLIPYRDQTQLHSDMLESQFVSYCVVYHCICVPVHFSSGIGIQIEGIIG